VLARIQRTERLQPAPSEGLAAALARFDHANAEALARIVLDEQQRNQTVADFVATLDGGVLNPSTTLGVLADRFIADEQNKVRTGRAGLCRANMNRVCLEHWIDWAGPAADVKTISGTRWADGFAWLVSQVDKGVWGTSHADRILGTARRFVKWCWEHELLTDLPCNLTKREYNFTQAPKVITTWTLDEVRALWAAAGGQTKLHLALMLNCGFVGKDISDLRHREVDWSAGTITRKRSKTKGHGSVPVVCYKLWPATFALLQQHRSTDPDVVLLTAGGHRWITERQDPEDGYKRSDCVQSGFKYWQKRAGVKRAPKGLHATAASLLGTHPSYKFFTAYFLGHSPRGMAEKHYVKPNDGEFAEALKWLGEQFDLR
jgi:integrase